MNYTRDQLLALRPNGGNTICLAMRPRSGKHPKQIGSDASNLINVPITPYNGTAVQNVSIGLINCQSICDKSDEISDVINDMDVDALVVTETWLTGNVSDQKIQLDIHSIMQLGFTRKVGESSFFSVIL